MRRLEWVSSQFFRGDPPLECALNWQILCDGTLSSKCLCVCAGARAPLSALLGVISLREWIDSRVSVGVRILAQYLEIIVNTRAIFEGFSYIVCIDRIIIMSY